MAVSPQACRKSRYRPAQEADSSSPSSAAMSVAENSSILSDNSGSRSAGARGSNRPTTGSPRRRANIRLNFATPHVSGLRW